METLDRVFGALADPTRRAILARLASGEATVNELVAPFGLSQPTISKHLKVLEGAGLVSRGRKAQFRPVRLNPAPLAGAAEWLGDYRRFWEDSLERLAIVASDLQQRMKAVTADQSTADREVVITRVFDVPARFLFEAYSRPEHLRRWFGPVGWPLTLCEVDFRVGGRYRFAMTGPSGEQNTPFGGTYLEIVPDRKIVFDNRFETPGSPTMIMTVTLEEASDGRSTTLTLHTLFESRAMRDEYVGLGFVEGTNSGYDQLVDVVAELKAREAR